MVCGEVGDEGQFEVTTVCVGFEDVGEQPGGFGEVADGTADTVAAREKLLGYLGGDVSGDTGHKDPGASWNGCFGGGHCDRWVG